MFFFLPICKDNDKNPKQYISFPFGLQPPSSLNNTFPFSAVPLSLKQRPSFFISSSSSFPSSSSSCSASGLLTNEFFFFFFFWSFETSGTIFLTKILKTPISSSLKKVRCYNTEAIAVLSFFNKTAEDPCLAHLRDHGIFLFFFFFFFFFQTNFVLILFFFVKPILRFPRTPSSQIYLLQLQAPRPSQLLAAAPLQHRPHQRRQAFHRCCC
ncbi:unnamed protein product [Camellia sinensis]